MWKMTLGAAAMVALLGGSAFAQQGSGPVATACADDLAKYCAGKSHGNREARTCLEANKAKVSAACKTALDTTGGGKGKANK
jgi:hypothetical protein